MRNVAVIGALLLLSSQVHAQPVNEEPYWTPDKTLIEKLESRVEMPVYFGQRAYAKDQYNRFYAGVTINGKRVIRGKWIVPPNREDFIPTATHIIDIEDMPSLPGGGCANVSVMYTVDLNLASASCNLAKVDIPPAERPYWRPDTDTVADMERIIQNHLDVARPGLTQLKSFGRYYLGVTIDGKQMIQGSLSAVSTDKSIHLVGDRKDLLRLAGGQCANIRLLFDISAKKLNWLACDGERHIPLD